MRAAMASGSRDAIAGLLTDHFVSIDVQGNESTSDDMIDSVLKPDIDRSRREVATTLTSLEESNGVARVMQHYAMTTTAVVSPTTPKKLQTLSGDTWLLTDGEWRLAKTQTFEMELVAGSGAHRYLTAKGIRPSQRFPLFVTARMWEYIEPIARGQRYEDPLDAFLIRNGLGELDGGGTQMGDTPKIEFVDVTFWLRSSEDALALVAKELGRLGAPIGSELQFTSDQGDQVRSFGQTECVAIFLDGVTLPKEVYKTTDVNVVLGKLTDALANDDLGEFRAHWHGPRETALFFNGANAEAMKLAMLPVLISEPLCQNSRVIVRYGHHPKGSNEEQIPLKAP
ncbi:MAG TPA: nuclear transport factor 2 family protein [Candidatus Aquilonibacter sp.]|nr:nuclear transport factor 2 family protein [Candidatus Aquilonibacter sp.]